MAKESHASRTQHQRKWSGEPIRLPLVTIAGKTAERNPHGFVHCYTIL